MANVVPGTEPNSDHIVNIAWVTLRQVLRQAQFLFAEFPDTGDKIHAIIAVGTFCMDFSILKEKLPGVDFDDAAYDPKGTIQSNFKDLRQYLGGYSNKPYHILNQDRNGFHSTFIRAWGKARNVSPQFKLYN